ncbi:hypothetical protein C8R46DRAFT_1048439 [Mycena filopes]|nr:hypothetical protein C8R46DRAFT_1048439 [Mycena filopes]
MLNGSTHLGQMLLNKVAHRGRVTELDFWVELKCNTPGSQGVFLLIQYVSFVDAGLQDSYLTSTHIYPGDALNFYVRWVGSGSSAIEIFAEVLEFLRAPCPQRRVARTLIEILIRYLAVPQTQLQSTIMYHNLPFPGQQILNFSSAARRLPVTARKPKVQSFFLHGVAVDPTQLQLQHQHTMDSIPCAAHKAYLVPQILLGHSENFNPLRGFPEILFAARRLVHGPFKIFFRCAALMSGTNPGAIPNFLAARPFSHLDATSTLNINIPWIGWKLLFLHIRNADYWGFSAATSEIFFRCAAPT